MQFSSQTTQSPQNHLFLSDFNNPNYLITSLKSPSLTYLLTYLTGALQMFHDDNDDDELMINDDDAAVSFTL